jgi:predicted dienelactone hydrolase
MARTTALALLATASLIPIAQAQTTYHVGVTSRTFLGGDATYDWRGAKTHALLTTIWYPADAQASETQQWVGDAEHAFATAGRADRDAQLAVAPAKFPLILLSHWTGGSALMMAWLGTELAKSGYIAAAVNHPGNNALEDYTVQGFTLGWERAVDVSRVLDGMLADSRFGPRIDPQRVGAAGFSLGGYTMMVLAGAVASPIDLQQLEQQCSSEKLWDLLCYSPPEFPGLTQKAIALSSTDSTYRAALRKSADSHCDSRIRAVFAIAPAYIRLTRQSLGEISVPVEIVAGAGDPILPPASNAEILAHSIPRAKLTIYPGGVAHYTFLDTCTAGGKSQNPGLCVDAPGVDRDAVHAEAAGAAVAFFDEHLKR